MISMDVKLWELILFLKKSFLGNIIVNLLYSLGIIYVYNFFAFNRDRKNPTVEMRRSKLFFEENQGRIDNIVNLLEDDESKQVYTSMIKYRASHDWHDRPSYNRKNQYFPDGIIKLSDEEIFVDCGAYNGDTIKNFLKKCKKKYNYIVAIEPDEDNLEQIKKINGKIYPICAAAWKSDTEVTFQQGLGSSSHVMEEKESNKKVSAKSIDNIAECSNATFIKMDIEGSEYNALWGGVETIRRNKPKLAICIYHSDEDMLRLIELIAGWDLNYRFYIRQHAQKDAETVLYCI